MKFKSLFLLWACCAVLLVSCDKNEPATPAVRTVLIYVAADNSLSGFASKDLEEMKKGMAKVGSDRFHLLVYIDEGSSPRLIELQNRKGTVIEKVVKNYEKRNSVGLAETKEVFNDVFSNEAYRAGSYGLVYWSHGDGWIPNPLSSTRWVGQDKSNGDNYMNITDLVSIMKAAPHFDFVLFDACFMQAIEVAYALRNYTDYYIGSPTEIPGPGARYDILVPAMLTEGEIALKVAAAYYEPYSEIYTGGTPTNTNWTGGVSVCALKSSELEPLATITKQVLQKNAGAQELRSNAFDYDKRFASQGHVGYYDMVQMMQYLTDNTGYAAWKQAYDAAVSYWKTTARNYSGFAGMFSMSGTNGVSHYIPSSHPAANAAYRSTEWYEAAGLSQLDW